MKSFVAIVLFTLVTLLTVKEAVYVAIYRLHRAYIAETLCQNKDITQDISQRTCKGKCYVQKMAQNATKNAAGSSAPIPKMTTEITLFHSVIPAKTTLQNPPSSSQGINSGYLLRHSQDVTLSNIQPPETV